MHALPAAVMRNGQAFPSRQNQRILLHDGPGAGRSAVNALASSPLAIFLFGWMLVNTSLNLFLAATGLHVGALVPYVEMVDVSLQVGTLLEVFVVKIEIEVMRLDKVQEVHRIIEGGELAVGFINVRANILHALNAFLAD